MRAAPPAHLGGRVTVQAQVIKLVQQRVLPALAQPPRRRRRPHIPAGATARSRAAARCLRAGAAGGAPRPGGLLRRSCALLPCPPAAAPELQVFGPCVVHLAACGVGQHLKRGLQPPKGRRVAALVGVVLAGQPAVGLRGREATWVGTTRARVHWLAAGCGGPSPS